jgi:shikimate kinase
VAVAVSRCFTVVGVLRALVVRTQAIVAERGWDAFRDLESACLTSTLETHSHKCIISCGGGIVESASARATLKVRIHLLGRSMHYGMCTMVYSVRVVLLYG